MQSSSVVTFRALIMLSCLVAVPLAAVFGTSLPGVVGALLAGRWPGGSDSLEGAISDSSRFEPVMPGEMGSIVPPRRMSAAAHGNALPLSASSPAASEGFGGPRPAMSGVVPAGHETPVFSGAAFNTAVQTPVTVVPPPVDRFTYIQDRLQQLGATYYLLEMLEKLEGREEQYRFHCCIPVGGNSSYTRKYEALDPSPLGAMVKVLQQVESRGTVGP